MDDIGNSQHDILWDEADALNRVMGQEAILILLVEAYIQDMPDIANSLEAALHQHDLPAAAKHAHAIKGGAGNLSTFAVAEITREIETLCLDSGDEQELLQLFGEFKELLEQTVAKMRDWQKLKA